MRPKRRAQRKAPLRKEVARQDGTYMRVLDSFADLLRRKAWVEKDELLKEAKAEAWGHEIRWSYVVDFMTNEHPGVVIIALAQRFFASPRNKKLHSVDPGKYLSPNYTQAAGFASLAQFAQSSERNREIAMAKYSQQQIAASRALETAERFNAAITYPTALEAPA